MYVKTMKMQGSKGDKNTIGGGVDCLIADVG